MNGDLTFASSPDFENPQDHDSDNTYVVIVRASDGTHFAEQTIEVIVGKVDDDPVLSVGDGIERISLTLYPNPGNSTIYIDGLDGKTYQYSLFNLLGSKVASGIVEQGRFNIPSDVANGSYILQVSDREEMIFRSRLLVQK